MSFLAFWLCRFRKVSFLIVLRQAHVVRAKNLMPFRLRWHRITALFINSYMQNKRTESDRQNVQPGSMVSYNNRENNRPGRVEDTQEKDDAINKDENRQPRDKVTKEKNEKNA